MNNWESDLQIAIYCEAVYPSPDAAIALCLLSPTGEEAEHRFTTVRELPKFLSYARYRNVNRWGVFVTPSVMVTGAKDRTKESFAANQQILYLETDSNEASARVSELFPRPSLLVRSSMGHRHIYWRLDEPITREDQEALMRAMVSVSGADPAATDVSRVLRLPGFHNRKPGKNNPVTVLESFAGLTSVDTLRAIASTAEKRVSPRPNAPVSSKFPDGVKHSKSEIDWAETHRRLAQGMPPEDVIAWLERRRQDKPNPTYYAQRTVQRAIASKQAG